MNTNNPHDGDADAARPNAVVYVTANHDFIVIDHRCLAVRERSTGDFIEHHALYEMTSLRGRGPGARLLVHAMGMELSVATVQRIRRPSAAERSEARCSGWPGLAQRGAAA